jgi:ABC-type branched-subunit amino acid transport system substrate-binding protein
MSPTHSRRRRLAAIVVLATLVLAACGNSGDDDDSASGSTNTTAKSSDSSSNVKLTGVPGVTDTEIRFSSFGTNSNNPLGTCVLKCYDEGVKAYFAYRNDQGGIYGRKLVLSKELDDELAKNQQRALEIISANDTFASFSATQIASGWADMAKNGIPLYTWNIFAEGRQPSVFGYTGAICFDCTTRTPAYVTKLVGAKKVASLGYGISENSKQAAQSVAKGLDMYSDATGGAKVVYLNDNLQFGLSNGVGPEVTAMKKAGVQLVFGSLDLNGMKTVANEMQRQGMGDVPMYHPNTYDADFVKAAGQLFEGDYVLTQARPFEADAAGSALDTFKQWMSKTNAKVVELAMYGWIAADLAYQGLKAAGPNFDRAKVIEASNTKLTNYTADGLIPPIDWSRQHQPPTQDDPATHGGKYECSGILKVHNGVFEPVAKKSTPWFCWPGNTRAWSEPQEMNFK